MYDIFHICLDNSEEEFYRISIPELEECTHSGECHN